MKDYGKHSVLGVLVDAVDYQAAVARITEAARERRTLTVSALAVHGVMTGVLDSRHKYRLNRLDLVVPDGQPVRWALNALYHLGLTDRVYGPSLMLKLCERAERDGLPLYFYGTTPQILAALKKNLQQRFPRLQIAGTQSSKFRSLSMDEKGTLANEIQSSGAAMVFVGLGCPRQEVWAFEFREELRLPIICVGAGFAFHAGFFSQAPALLQNCGLEWAFRLCSEPRRLWRRYAFLNPLFLFYLGLQLMGLRFDTLGEAPHGQLLYG